LKYDLNKNIICIENIKIVTLIHKMLSNLHACFCCKKCLNSIWYKKTVTLVIH